MGSKVKGFIGIGAALAASAWMATAHAQSYPTQQVKLVVPFSPGGGVDQVARILAPELAKRLGQAVIIDNRTGASGAIGTAEVARAKPDGHTLLLVLDTHAVNSQLMPNLKYDPITSFEYVSLLVTIPLVLVASASFPASTLPELVAQAKANPHVSYGSAGTGSSAHLAGATLALGYGVSPTHIPFKGAGPLMTDLLGGHIDYAFSGLSVVMSRIKTGKLKAIAVGSSGRLDQLPGVPAVSEFVPKFEATAWIGMMAPAGTPRDVVARLLTTVRQTVAMPEIRKQLTDSGFEIVASSPEELVKRVKRDTDTVSSLIQKKLLTPE
jgi:tripartite-type tricarboxylate transporter receptor subunit TctC